MTNQALTSPDHVDISRSTGASEDLVMVSDHDGTIRFLSNGWERVLGWKPSEMVGRGYHEFVHPDDLGVGREAIRGNEMSGAVLRFANRYRTKTGNWCDLEWRVVADEHRGHLNASARDISEECARIRRLERMGEVAALIANPVVMCDREGHIEWVNEAFERVTGLRFDQVCAQRLESILPNECLDQEAAARITYALYSREPVEVEFHKSTGNGVAYWLRMEIQPTFDHAGAHTGFIVIETDISELATARETASTSEKQLLRERTRFVAAVDAISDGFVYFDANDRLVFANRRYREIYSIDEFAKIEGVHFDDMLSLELRSGRHADAPGREEVWLQERLFNRRSKSSVQQRLSDGTVLQIVERPTVDDGWIGLHVDVSELYAARDRAEAANRAKSEFLCNMSHEIRTPLNGVLGMAEMLAETPLSGDQRLMLETIRDSGWSLLTLLNDVVDLARVEAGMLELVGQPFDFNKLVKQLELLHSAHTSAKGIVFVCAGLPMASSMRLGDEKRVMQILHNLVGNAIKFTQKGSVMLMVTASDPSHVVFIVRDTGIGMSQEQLGRVLRPFEQAEAGTDRSFGGAGLGLTIVQKLVKLMQGDFEIVSSLGCGTSVTVRLRLPIAPV